MKIQYLQKIPTVEEYNYLTEAVGWGTEPDAVVENALKHTSYSVCAYHEDQIVGYARMIGDETLFLYIQDVMVAPDMQGQGIGKMLMRYVLDEVARVKEYSPNVRTYLGASKNREDFYRQFGFMTRRDADLGEGMVLF